MSNVAIRIIGTLMAIIGAAGTGFGILGMVASADDPVLIVLFTIPIIVVSLIILGIGLIAAKK